MKRWLSAALVIPSLVVFTTQKACAQGFDAHAAARASLRNQEPAFELYRRVAEMHQKQNIVVSPHSVLMALSMLYPASRGQTQASLAETLNLPLTWEQFQSEQISLTRLWSASRPFEEEDFGPQISIANDLWAASGLQVRENYVNALRLAFDASLHTLDFAGNPEGSVQTINSYISNKTGGHIDGFLQASPATRLIRAILTNAIHFKGAWKFPFSEDTVDKVEFRADGGEVQLLDMMALQEHLDYRKTEEYTAVSLPFSGDTVRMVIMIPNSGTVAELEQSLTPDELRAMVSGFTTREIRLSLPKFKIFPTSNVDLIPHLKDMGLSPLFCGDSGVDLSGMGHGVRAVCVSEVLHRAVFDVNEKGVEAAAATAVIVGPGDAPDAGPVPMPIPVRVDRSSLFLLTHTRTNEILFMGRLWKP